MLSKLGINVEQNITFEQEDENFQRIEEIRCEFF